MTDTSIEATIATISPEMPHDNVAAVLMLVESHYEQFKAMRDRAYELIGEWCRENKAELVIGTMKYWWGDKKDNKCPDKVKALEQLFIAAGGDFKRVAACISADGIKPGESRQLLKEAGMAEKWDEIFTVEVRGVLKDGEVKPEKKLRKVDTRFLK